MNSDYINLLCRTGMQTLLSHFNNVIFCWMILLAVTGCAHELNHPTTNISVPDQGKSPILVIVSPAHPATYNVIGNDKLGQDLRWDQGRQLLCAYITYSRVSGGGDDELDPANYRVLEVPFPTVRLDGSNQLYVLDKDKNIRIGHLEKRAYRNKVVLKSNVELSAHRINNELSAKLIVSADNIKE